MTERNRTAVRVDVLGVVRNAELGQAGEPLRRKSFVQPDQIEVADLATEPLHQLAGRRHRPNSHDAGRNARRRHAEDAGTGREPMLLRGLFRGDDHGGTAVVAARGAAGGARPGGWPTRVSPSGAPSARLLLPGPVPVPA